MCLPIRQDDCRKIFRKHVHIHSNAIQSETILKMLGFFPFKSLGEQNFGGNFKHYGVKDC